MKKFLIILCLVIFSPAVTVRQDTLDNGLLVLSVEAHKIPLVQMRVMVRAGSFYDPVGQEGLANAVNQLLILGSRMKSADEIAETIESAGADVSLFCDEDFAGMNGRALASDLGLLISILKECLVTPAFDSVQFARLKSRLVSQIRAAQDDPDDLAGREFRQLVFDGTPYAHDPSGTDTAVKNLKISDVRSFYEKHYGANQAIIVCVGDFQSDSLITRLKNEFRDWPRRPPVETVFNPPSLPSGPTGKIVRRDISQAYILLGFPGGPDLRAPDWNAARLMNYILGGSGLISRIAHNIREQKGLAYSAGSYFGRLVNAGAFYGRAQTKKEMAFESVKSLIHEISRIKDDVTADELAGARKYYTGHFPLTFDTYAELASMVSQIQIENLGFDYFERYEGEINRVTMEQIKAAAVKYLHPESFYLVVVGDVRKEDFPLPGIRWLEE